MKFEKAKKLSALEILKLLQKLTKNNLSTMKYNNGIANKLSINLNSPEQQTDLIKQCFNANNQLFKQNREHLELHTKLLYFLKSLDKDLDSQIENIENITPEKFSIINQWKNEFEEYFIKTTEGRFNYDNHHPFFYNEKFRQKLIDYYSKAEEYEICADLVKKNVLN